MELIAGLYWVSQKHQGALKNIIQAVFFPQSIECESNGVYRLTYQGNEYQIRQKEEEVGHIKILEIYSDSPRLISAGYQGGGQSEFIGTAHTVGIPLLLRYLICQVEAINIVECEAFNAKDFNILLERKNKRLTSNGKILKYYRSTFNENQLIEESDINFSNFELVEVERINSQPYIFSLISSVNKEMSIEEFILGVGVRLNWDNSFFFETLFIPQTSSEMMSRFRLDLSREKMLHQGLLEDKETNINMIFREDELSYIVELTDRYVYIEENFWWS